MKDGVLGKRSLNEYPSLLRAVAQNLVFSYLVFPVLDILDPRYPQ